MEDVTENERVRRYYLFVHYNVKKHELIWERRRLTLDDSFYERLRKDLKYLVDIVGRGKDDLDHEWEGRAFVFIDVGWTRLLRTESVTAARTLALDLQRVHNEIMERLCLAECRRNTCRERREQRVASWPVPVQIITAADLIELLTIIDKLEDRKSSKGYSRLSQYLLDNGETLLRDASKAADLVELLKIIAEMEERQPSEEHHKLSQYLVGNVDTLRYDASKAIEGMIRIASVGRNIPIFRFDDDVIFYGQRVYDMCWKEEKKEEETEEKKEKKNKLKNWEEFKKDGSLITEMEEVLREGEEERLDEWRKTRIEKTRKSILKLCERYNRACANPRLHYFVFSGHYESEGEVDLNDIFNGFATRVAQLAQLPERPNNTDGAFNTEGEVTIDENAAETFLRELHEIGANPHRQVISGAGLCLSDGAILDLPPYSNMRMNVMWIDDHLKYALHDELEHFDIHGLDVGSARKIEARFPQLRHAGPPTYKDVGWHINQYMERLLLGAIADAWLRKTSDMKTPILSDTQPPFLPEDFVRAQESRRTKRPHIYAKAFLSAVPTGASPVDAWKLHRTLWEAAVKRLSEICKLWGKAEYNNTFLGLFLEGNNHERSKQFPKYIHKHYPNGLRRAVEDMAKDVKDGKTPYDDQEYKKKNPKDCLKTESKYLDELPLDDIPLSDSVRVLIHDFIDYFETVGFWSRYVRAVRFLVNRSGQNRELQWLFPPDESYGDSTRIESIVHILEQLMDLRLDREDFDSLIGKFKRDGEAGGEGDSEGERASENEGDSDGESASKGQAEDWRPLGQYTNNQYPQVTLYADEIKAYAKRNKCRADALWLIVMCYHLAHAIVIRGHGHNTVAQDGVEWEESSRFALAYTYFFLESEGKQNETKLLKELESKLAKEDDGEGKSLEEGPEEVGGEGKSLEERPEEIGGEGTSLEERPEEVGGEGKSFEKRLEEMNRDLYIMKSNWSESTANETNSKAAQNGQDGA